MNKYKEGENNNEKRERRDWMIKREKENNEERIFFKSEIAGEFGLIRRKR